MAPPRGSAQEVRCTRGIVMIYSRQSKDAESSSERGEGIPVGRRQIRKTPVILGVGNSRATEQSAPTRRYEYAKSSPGRAKHMLVPGQVRSH